MVNILITHLYLILVPIGMQPSGLSFHVACHSLLFQFLFLMPWGFIPSGLTLALLPWGFIPSGLTHTRSRFWCSGTLYPVHTCFWCSGLYTKGLTLALIPWDLIPSGLTLTLVFCLMLMLITFHTYHDQAIILIMHYLTSCSSKLINHSHAFLNLSFHIHISTSFHIHISTLFHIHISIIISFSYLNAHKTSSKFFMLIIN